MDFVLSFSGAWTCCVKRGPSPSEPFRTARTKWRRFLHFAMAAPNSSEDAGKEPLYLVHSNAWKCSHLPHSENASVWLWGLLPVGHLTSTQTPLQPPSAYTWYHCFQLLMLVRCIFLCGSMITLLLIPTIWSQVYNHKLCGGRYTGTCCQWPR